MNQLINPRLINHFFDNENISILQEFSEFRTKCGLLWSYDWVSIPLVYTQVVTLATYSFFAVALIGRQYIDGVEKQFQLKIDKYLPIFTILQFFFFMGLLKVAEQLINPFGDDDEDFELNWLIDRHIKVETDSNLFSGYRILRHNYIYMQTLGIVPRGGHADEPLPAARQGHLLRL